MKTTAQREEEKYAEMWTKQAYRIESPGMTLHKTFLELMERYALDVDGEGEKIQQPTLYDYGCGEGLTSLAFLEQDFKVTAFDITDGGLSHEIQMAIADDCIDFIKGPLWDFPLMSKSRFGYCCDVMEHIPKEYVREVLRKIICNTSEISFFSIAQIPDGCGQLIGQQLHLTVEKFEWWKAHILDFGDIIECRDCASFGVFLVDGRGLR